MSRPDPGSGRPLPDPGFAGDDGAVGASVAAALDDYRPGLRGSYQATLAVLQASRLVVPVVAVLGEVAYDEQGLAHDKTSDMATVMITGADGRQGLLAFTGTEALTAWRPDARPVPVAFTDAAAAAVSEGADALILDLAGPVSFVVEGADLHSLAQRHVLTRLDEDTWGWVTLAE